MRSNLTKKKEFENYYVAVHFDKIGFKLTDKQKFVLFQNQN